MLKEESRLENSQAQKEEAQQAEIDEHMQMHRLEAKHVFRYQTDTVSFLTLGGWDERSHTGDMVWFDTSDSVGGWNITAAAVTFSDDIEWSYVPEEDSTPETNEDEIEMPTIVFQTAFPWIGIPEAEFTPL